MLMNELKNENKINDMDVGGHLRFIARMSKPSRQFPDTIQRGGIT